MHTLCTQDISVQSKDFEGSLLGFSQHFKCRDSKHGKLVMPEPLVNFEHVDAARRKKRETTSPSSDASTSVAQLKDLGKKQSEYQTNRGQSHHDVIPFLVNLHIPS